ncbi:DUF6529 family protein [Georgenia sp. SYP-B2076]|uniref:DUF6529 family protein n=1 Tax=Georgenia sp. SYP-B2076 TaxID=2495881 RepID=UPI001F0C5A49|nr:DUF6529 family protein [Georgenia sp. SYP-B2076]
MGTMDPHAPVRARAGPSRRARLLAVLALGVGVAVALGVYGRLHPAAGRPLFTLGFSGMLQMKAWLGSAAVALLLVQVTTALWMWGRLPGAGTAPPWAALVHRYSGSVAFVLTLPVAFHCLWALGLATTSPRVVVHGIAGCLFYGAFAAKMLGLRVRRLPRRAIPLLGVTLLALLVLAWLTAALWLFTRPGIPLT